MLANTASWVLLLSAASNVLASPLSSSLTSRQISCPPGLHCGPGPVCTIDTCHLAGCADAEVCQDNSQKRQISCPPGVHCGHGPVCTKATCNLAGCADAAVCQDSQNKKRQFECPDGLDCGHGPVCTAELCDLPGCADAEVCTNLAKRSGSVVPPVCDICIKEPDGKVVCGCTTTDAPPALRQREAAKICPQYCIVTADGEYKCGCAAEKHERRTKSRVCPLYCIAVEDGQTLCGCAAEDYLKSHPGSG